MSKFLRGIFVKIRKLSIALFLVLSLLAGCGADGGKVSTEDVFKKNSDADIFQYDGFYL